MKDMDEYMRAADKALLGTQNAGQALQNLESALPGVDSLIAQACFALSQNKYREGDLDAAEALTRRAMNIWDTMHGPDHIGLSTCFNNLGRIYEERGLMAEGIGFHRKALKMRRRILGEHEETAFSMGNLGTALAMDNQWEEAAMLLEECVACYAKVGTVEEFKVEGYKKNLEICRKMLKSIPEMK